MQSQQTLNRNHRQVNYIKSLFPMFLKGLEAQGYWRASLINSLGQHQIITHFNHVQTQMDQHTLRCLTRQTHIKLITDQWKYIESSINGNKQHLLIFDQKTEPCQHFKSLNETHSEQMETLTDYCSAFENKTPLIYKKPPVTQSLAKQSRPDDLDHQRAKIQHLDQIDSLLNKYQLDFDTFSERHTEKPQPMSIDAFTHLLSRIKLGENKVQVTSHHHAAVQSHQGRIINLLQLNNQLIIGDAGFKCQINLHSIKQVWHWQQQTAAGRIEQVMLVDYKGRLALSISRWL
ncbi:hypothetical protein P8S54_03870 [Thiomicrospira sp. R3]|uniref:hypothetical protein n=1 Tax=Thiomicrospira sp. R3 TaxID=3035472 RepID=UPI00259AF01C|nr:hypothetical protein [Thiomicrospira sp. R3]WFE69444.1 hypothetical protein P8S54_03870 [Thiomicrospira sp. R3]